MNSHLAIVHHAVEIVTFSDTVEHRLDLNMLSCFFMHTLAF